VLESLSRFAIFSTLGLDPRCVQGTDTSDRLLKTTDKPQGLKAGCFGVDFCGMAEEVAEKVNLPSRRSSSGAKALLIV
jgi:hypothetical protein